MRQTKGKVIEVFTADCYLCEETLGIIDQAQCDECTVIERNISKDCGCGCLDKAREYGLKTIPTIVIDGKVAIEGKPTVERVRKALCS